MKNKICFKCGISKPLSDFYKHPKMPDGHVNKCIECNKKDVKENYNKNITNPDYVLKERKRGREKYKRLGYKDKYSFNILKYKFRKSSIFKNIHRKLKLSKEEEAHHWNYNNGFELDVIILSKSKHKKIHQNMILDIEYLLYRDNELNLLDTREKHLKYINKLKF